MLASLSRRSKQADPLSKSRTEVLWKAKVLQSITPVGVAQDWHGQKRLFEIGLERGGDGIALFVDVDVCLHVCKYGSICV